MRTYWGIKAIIKNDKIVDITNEPEVFEQVGEMSTGVKVYADKSGKQFFRQRLYNKFVFIPF